MEGSVRKRMVATSTEIERFGVQFDTRTFAKERRLSIEAMAQGMGIKGSNFHNWFKADNYHPLSVVKAILIQYDRDNIPAWEQKYMDGKIVRKKSLPWRVSPRVMELAEAYNELRQGVRLRTTTNEVLEIPVLSAPALHLVGKTEEHPAVVVVAEPEVEVEVVVPPEPTPTTRLELPTAFGTLVVDVPQLAMSVGEREIYTNLILRLNHQISILVAEKRQVELKVAAAEARVSSQGRRIQELVQENKALDELLHHGIKDQTPTLERLTSPRNANGKDYENVKAAVKVPALISMLEDMSKGFHQGTHVS